MSSQNLLSIGCIALGEHLASLLNTPSNAVKANNPTASTVSVAKNQRELSTQTLTSSSSKDMRVSLRRDALNAFADACGYAARAENYELAIHAARHYWNLSMSYLQQQSERATLYENLAEILKSLQIAFKFKAVEVAKVDETASVCDEKKDETKKVEEKLEAEVKGNSKKPGSATPKNKTADLKKKGGGGDKITESQLTNYEVVEQALVTKQEPAFDPYEDAFDDLTLRCVLYACLFQVLIDRQDYEEALEAMESALNDLPRTKHRLLIYRIKVITKSKLGLDVQMDLQKVNLFL